MEKIYEEQTFKPKRRQLNFSVVLSFVVALFAIGSLIAVGFNQISYAVGEEETFTLSVDNTGLVVNGLNFQSDGVYVYVPLLYAGDASNPIFCVEQGVDASNNATYSSGETPSYSDIGLSYILSKYYDGTIVNGDLSAFSAEDATYIKKYVTQIAIWLYLDETTDSTDPRHGQLTAAQKEVLKGAVKLSKKDISANTSVDIVEDDETTLYGSYIKPVVDAAKTQTISRTVQAQFASTNIDKISNGQIFQTSEIGVVANPSDSLLRYYVRLEGMPDAYVVDKDGNKVESLTPFNPTDKFYIRVPVDKVTTENSSVNLIISGDFSDVKLGEFYAGGNSQQVVRITSQYPRIENSQLVNFLVSPDTGMTTAQTIYFIGLIVLLCGVGIIYANAKPIEE